jgi:3-hydroxyisobutyrate dehydrogenase-like beta-hydroxyacid dehydrogenase
MTIVGIVSPGAMGSAVGGALLRGGARVVATVVGRSERTARLAREVGLELVPGVADVVAGADVVLSIVPPDQAEMAGAQLSGVRLLVDLNAVSPATARRISAEVDGSISGPPPHRSGTTRIYLSGPRAPEVAALPFDGIDVIVVGDDVGAASAVKMSTASVYKGSIALLAQALRAADHYGVVEPSCPISASSPRAQACGSRARRRRPTGTSARCTRSARPRRRPGSTPPCSRRWRRCGRRSRGLRSARSLRSTRVPTSGRFCGNCS